MHNEIKNVRPTNRSSRLMDIRTKNVYEMLKEIEDKIKILVAMDVIIAILIAILIAIV